MTAGRRTVDRDAIGVALTAAGIRLGGRWALQPVTLQLDAGTKWAVVGANGAGKTLLIKLLTGRKWPTATARAARRWLDANGDDLHGVDARPRLAYVGAESQDAYARRGWNFTLREIVTTGVYGTDIPLDRPSAAVRRRVSEWLDRFDLRSLAQRRMLEVSYGQRRLALIARAMAGNPGLLALDEAYNGLDGAHREALDCALAGVVGRGLTLLVSAHRAADLPAGLDAIVEVADGRVAAPRRWSRALARRTLEPVHSRPVAIRMPPAHAPREFTLQRVRVFREYRLALGPLDWQVRRGDRWAVVGHNGSGKSTLLQLLYGAQAAATGGRLVRHAHPPRTPLDEVRARLGLVSCELQTDYERTATVLEIVVSGLRNSIGLDEPASAAERRVARRALSLLGLERLARRTPPELSYGQMRLVLFARAFARDPAVLLLDEPLTGLDPARRDALLAALARMATDVTQIIAVHHRDDLPSVVGRVLRLRHGRRQAR